MKWNCVRVNIFGLFSTFFIIVPYPAKIVTFYSCDFITDLRMVPWKIWKGFPGSSFSFFTMVAKWMTENYFINYIWQLLQVLALANADLLQLVFPSGLHFEGEFVSYFFLLRVQLLNPIAQRLMKKLKYSKMREEIWLNCWN